MIYLPRANKIFATLLFCIGLLVILDIAAYKLDWGPLSELLSLNEESNLPAWYSAIQFSFLGLLLFLVSWKERREGPLSAARAIAALAAAQFFFSLDEIAEIHEKITRNLKHLDWVPRFEGNHGIWIFVYGGVAVAVLAALAPGLLQFARRHKGVSLKFSIGAFLWLAGGVGVEILMYGEIFTGELQILLEETLELAGVAVMIWAALINLEPVRISFQNND